MTYRCKALCGASGTEDELGTTSEMTLTYEAWATTQVERDASDYFPQLFSIVKATAPTTVLSNPGATPPQPGLYRGPIRWREDDSTQQFLFDVQYSARKQGESLLRWSFDTQGGSVKLFTSKATARYPGTAPDHENSIGVTDDGEVEGTEIVIPTLKLTARYRWPKASSTFGPTSYMAYIKQLTESTGRTNNALWKTYPQGTLLFLGASGEFVDGKDNEIEYHFAASANASGLSIGAIAGIAKRGHDYLWIKFKHEIVSSQKTRRPAAVYVERVYDELDFSSFGIGS